VTQVNFLDNDSFEFKGVRILGCTLWTDFRLGETTQAAQVIDEIGLVRLGKWDVEPNVRVPKRANALTIAWLQDGSPKSSLNCCVRICTADLTRPA
jgi:hypothetical protein